MWNESVTYVEPQSYEEAVNDPLYGKEWRAAVKEEYGSLMKNRLRRIPPLSWLSGIEGFRNVELRESTGMSRTWKRWIWEKMRAPPPAILFGGNKMMEVHGRTDSNLVYIDFVSRVAPRRISDEGAYLNRITVLILVGKVSSHGQ
jgi:hypothetical protein